jgi:hypothetical protein
MLDEFYYHRTFFPDYKQRNISSHILCKITFLILPLVHFFNRRQVKRIKLSSADVLVFVFTENQRVAYRKFLESSQSKIYENLLVINFDFKFYNLLAEIALIGRNFRKRKFSRFKFELELNSYLNAFAGNYVIHFNDHSPQNIFIYNKCSSKNVKSVFVQHAGVNNRFPPLYNSINYLFDTLSEKIYRDNGIRDEVRQIEILTPKERNKKKALPLGKIPGSVVIAYGKYDSVDLVRNVYRELRLHGFNVYIKAHPALRLRHFFKLFNYRTVNYIDNSLIFAKFEALVVADSYVMVEAYDLGCKVYVYPGLTERYRDNYLFVKYGYIKNLLKSERDLVNALNTYKSNFRNDEVLFR